MSRKLLWTGFALLLAAGALAFFLYAPYAGFQSETFVRLEKGTDTITMGRALEQAGVIRYAWAFWLERAFRPTTKLQAGEYRFNQPASVSDIFDRLARGDVYYFEFTVPEGTNMFDIAQALERAGAMPASEFLRAAADPAPIRDLAPEAKTLEGYLFPDTYRLSHWASGPELCRQMTDQFRRQWKKLAAGRDVDVHRIVTLASLVEKETGIASERPLVAGVFVNRLKIGMRLECDPTAIYAALLDNRFRGVIHQSDLANQNLYNTYQHSGLPPGPITNPGADAISAALDPAEKDFLYFVAKPQGGGHEFSATLAEHQRAIQKYRHGAGNASKKARKAG